MTIDGSEHFAMTGQDRDAHCRVDPDTDAGAEIDGTEMPGSPAVPPDTCGAAIPIPAARIAVKLAITALFCMVAAVFMSVETRTGSFEFRAAQQAVDATLARPPRR